MTAGPSRLAALRDAQPFRDAHVPGHPELAFKFGILTRAAVQDLRAEAEAQLKKKGIDTNSVLNADAMEEEIATQVLARVMRDAERPKVRSFAIDADDVRDNISPEVGAELFNQWNEFRVSQDPWPEELGSAELAAIEDAIKKKDRIRLRSIGSAALANFLLITGSQLETSPTGKSESSSE